MRCLDSLVKMLSLRWSLRERIYVTRTTRGLMGGWGGFMFGALAKSNIVLISG